MSFPGSFVTKTSIAREAGTKHSIGSVCRNSIATLFRSAYNNSSFPTSATRTDKNHQDSSSIVFCPVAAAAWAPVDRCIHYCRGAMSSFHSSPTAAEASTAGTTATKTTTNPDPCAKNAAHKEPAAAAAADVYSLPPINKLRLCGTSWAPCGYCKGARAHLAAASSSSTTRPSERSQQQQQQQQGEDDQDGNNSSSISSSSQSYSVVAMPQFSTELYEAFLGRGWRRSGVALYKPLNFVSCCPALTIRLPVDLYQPAKAQRKVLGRMQRILNPTLPPLSAARLVEVGNNNNINQDSAIHKPNQERRQQRPPVTKNSDTTTTAAATLSSSSSSSSMDEWVESLLHHSGVLQALEAWTETTLTQIVTTMEYPQQPHERHHPTPNPLATKTASWTVPFVRYKVQQRPNGRKHVRGPGHESPTTTSVAVTTPTPTTKPFQTVILFSTVCAALSGQSKGRLDRIDLGQSVVSVWQTQHPEFFTGNSRNVHVVKTECHVPSGHLLVHVTLSKPTTDVSIGTNTLLTGSKRRIDPDMPKPVDHPYVNAIPSGDDDDGDRTPAVLPNDKFRDWWKATSQLGSPPTPPYQISVTSLPAHESALDPRVHQLYWEYQHLVHQDPNPLKNVPLRTNGQQDSSFRDEKLNTTVGYCSGSDDIGDVFNDPNQANWGRDYAPSRWRPQALTMLSREYRHVSVDEQNGLLQSYISFYEFLVENPFDNMESNTNSSKFHAGTYHQHYTISGDVLVAVGVVDVLPTGLSSVYLFYSPSFAHNLAPLGKFAILKEIEWTKKLGRQFYYLGYFIQDCQKMMYKADYHPSELLCPTTYHWVDAEIAKAILRKESPDHHCCTLFKGCTFNGCTKKNSNGHSLGQSLVSVDHIRMDVGVDTPVTLPMLHTDGRALVGPLLQDFLDQSGPDISLKCTICLH